MVQSKLVANVRRLNDKTSVIDIEGDVTGQAESALGDAYAQASAANPRCVLLNFSKLDYMNSSGIGVLVMLLVRAQRQKQKLLAYGLNEHYRQIFQLTRLDDVIGIFAGEAEAMAAVN
jgi:anti-sigma B factor antagonist